MRNISQNDSGERCGPLASCLYFELFLHCDTLILTTDCSIYFWVFSRKFSAEISENENGGAGNFLSLYILKSENMIKFEDIILISTILWLRYLTWEFHWECAKVLWWWGLSTLILTTDFCDWKGLKVGVTSRQGMFSTPAHLFSSMSHNVWVSLQPISLTCNAWTCISRLIAVWYISHFIAPIPLQTLQKYTGIDQYPILVLFFPLQTTAVGWTYVETTHQEASIRHSPIFDIMASTRSSLRAPDSGPHIGLTTL
jgi:hypothetical protein